MWFPWMELLLEMNSHPDFMANPSLIETFGVRPERWKSALAGNKQRSEDCRSVDADCEDRYSYPRAFARLWL